MYKGEDCTSFNSFLQVNQEINYTHRAGRQSDRAREPRAQLAHSSDQHNGLRCCLATVHKSS
jgi:hypothetical protein